jgi:prophage regulatory protein
MEAPDKKTGRRLLDYPALRGRGIRWSRVHIGRLEAAKRFPRHIDVGGNTIAWFEDEIDDFLEMKAAERDAKVEQLDVPESAAAAKPDVDPQLPIPKEVADQQREIRELSEKLRAARKEAPP